MSGAHLSLIWAQAANAYISAGTDNDSAGQKPATMSVRALKARSKGRITLLLWLNDVSVDLSDLFDHQTNEVDFFFATLNLKVSRYGLCKNKRFVRWNRLLPNI